MTAGEVVIDIESNDRTASLGAMTSHVIAILAALPKEAFE